MWLHGSVSNLKNSHGKATIMRKYAFSLKSKSAQYQKRISNRQEERLLDLYFSKTPSLAYRRKPFQYVFNEFALLHPETPLQRASNLLKEAATMSEVYYLLNRISPIHLFFYEHIFSSQQRIYALSGLRISIHTAAVIPIFPV